MSFTPGPGTTYLLTSTQPIPSGTANGVLYLNGSKVVTSGSALTFDGTNFTYQSAISLLNNDGNGNKALLTPFAYGGSGATGTLVLSSTYGNVNQQRIRVGVGGVSAISFDIDSAEQMRLNSTGLGIGTSSPAGKLDTRGTAYLGSDSNNSLVVDSTSSTVTIAAAGRTAFSTSALRFLTSDGTAALERMRLDSSGNLGLGVTPSAWFSTRRVIQIGQSGSLAASTNSQVLDLGSNALLDSAGNFKYIATGFASYYRQFDSVHSWHVAPSGTAGNAISFTQAMTLDASGNLGIGTTSTASGRLTVDSNSGIPSLLLTNSSTGNPYLSFQSGGFIQDLSGGSLRIRAATALGYIDFDTNATRRFRIDNFGNSIFGTAALATSATDGFLYVPTCAGTPTGTPTTYTGTAPIVVDTTNNKLYFYSGGAWRDAGP